MRTPVQIRGICSSSFFFHLTRHVGVIVVRLRQG